MKVLITGGAGFIGSHISDLLLAKGYSVVVVDNLISGHRHNLSEQVKFYQADVRENLDDLFIIEKPDFVIHQAAQVSVSHSLSDPLYDGEENIMSTINMLNLCVKHQVRKFIFASSAAIYGNSHYLPIDEKHPVSPISFYGLSKWNAEQYITLFAEIHSLPVAILRYSNVYGPRQDVNGEAGVIAIFIHEQLAGRKPIIFGDGRQTRDFVYVKDVARANVAALEATSERNLLVNISTQSETSLLDIVQQMSINDGSLIEPIHKSTRKGDIRASVLSNQKAIQLLDWSPAYTFEAGFSETMAYYKQDVALLSKVASK